MSERPPYRTEYSNTFFSFSSLLSLRIFSLRILRRRRFDKSPRLLVCCFRMKTGGFAIGISCIPSGRLHRPPACSRRAGGKRAFERPPREPAKELTQILRSAGEHLPRRWVLGEPKPADGPFSGGRITGESPPARLLHAGGRWTAPLLENSWIRRRIRRPTRKRRQRP